MNELFILEVGIMDYNVQMTVVNHGMQLMSNLKRDELII